MTASVLRDWFGWDNGSVLTNLVASVIAFTAGFTVGGVWVKKHVNGLHARLNSLHAKHDALSSKLDNL